MVGEFRSVFLRATAISAALAVSSAVLASSAEAADTATILYNFGASATDGAGPVGDLLQDSHGNFFGVTWAGGARSEAQPNGYGTVFELSPPAQAGGNWTETVLYSFGVNTADGVVPLAGLIMDTNGNLYGTTLTGGSPQRGTVFELSPPTKAGAPWTEKILHRFQKSQTASKYPAGRLVMDAAGNLFGTTQGGGAYVKCWTVEGVRECPGGTVFELSPPAKKWGSWTKVTLHSFGENTSADGLDPYAGLIMDSKGNLFGTTLSGGVPGQCTAEFCGSGTVFEISPPTQQGGAWTEKTLHIFGLQPPDGVRPVGALLMDGNGDLFGTTAAGGGAANSGTVFELSPPTQAGGAWTEAVLYSFGANATDGVDPEGALMMDRNGVLYGVTMHGGANSAAGSGSGTAFALSPPAQTGGAWSETILYNFGATSTDGTYPFGSLIFDAKGNLHGLANSGGANNGDGEAFMLSP